MVHVAEATRDQRSRKAYLFLLHAFQTHSSCLLLAMVNPALLVVVVQSPSCVQLFVTPQTAAGQASLSLTISQSLPKFMSIESVMPFNHFHLLSPSFMIII